jgi:hypothetical protein
MAWLIGIVCVILMIRFWRIFLPLGLIAGAALGLLWLSESRRSDAQAKAAQKLVEGKNLRIQRALNAEPKKGLKWELGSEIDPASGKEVQRTAAVSSENDLCRLQVEERVDGTRLAGIYCSELYLANKYAATAIEVKFDNRDKSDSMLVNRFSGANDSYISSRQYSDNLSYDEFIERLATANRVALYLNFEDIGNRWVAFSLLDADKALSAIGALKSKTSSRRTRE